MKKVLLVIDMVNDFIDREGTLYCGEDAVKIVDLIDKKIDEYNDAGNDVIFICDYHKENDKEFERFPEHAIAGSTGSLLIDKLSCKNGFLVHKTRYSGFFKTDLEEVLYLCESNLDIEVELCGVCTSICIMCTAIDLCNRDIKTTVDSTCVADFDPANHKFSLEYMKNILGVNVI